MRVVWRALAVGVVCAAMTGCHHKVPPPVLPVAPPAPVPLEPAPEPKTPPQLAQVPVQPVPLPTVNPPAKKTRRVKKPVVPTPAAAPAPVQVASSGLPPDPNVIGALTPGDAAPGMSQQAAELIASLDRRMAGLSADFKEKQRDQLAKVNNFEKQAQSALKLGDADGALTLATKAKVLLDDLLK